LRHLNFLVKVNVYYLKNDDRPIDPVNEILDNKSIKTKQMRKVVLVVSILLFGGQLMSQPWLKHLSEEKSQSENIKFYDLQKNFHKYWKGKDLNNKLVTKGRGYKPFKRWEEFMIPRVYPNGDFPSYQIWNEYKKLRNKKILKSVPASNWNYIGPQNIPLDNLGKPTGMGRINCVSFDLSDANTIYLGAPSGGFWKSTDGGASWLTTTDELASIGVSDIAINPDNSAVIYIATGDGDASDTYSIGVVKSTNGGLNWSTTGLSETTNNNLIIRRLIINPDNSNILMAATNSGIYRTTNAGVSWSNVQSGHFKDLEINPANSNIVYAARYGSNSARFYKSIDAGVSFTEINVGVDLTETFRLELAVSGSMFSDVVYALYSEREQDGFHTLWKSSNAGENWSKVYDVATGMNLLGWESDGSDIGGQGFYDLSLAVSPTDESVIYVGGINIWKSVDSGTNWTLVGDWEGIASSYVHADHHYLTFSPSGVLFNGNDGGLYKSNNEGATWTDISAGLHILQIDRIGVSQKTSAITIVGNQDNGTMKYDASTNTWEQIYGGDGAECIVDYTDDNIIYVSYIKGDIQRSLNGGSTFSSIKPVGTNDGVWHTPFVMSPENSETLYIGFEDVWKSTDRGTNWQKISTNLSPGKPLTQLTVAPLNTNYLYATIGTKHWVTKNGGITWVEITSTSGLPDLYLNYFAIADNNPEHVWVVFSGFSDGEKVYFSDNAGETWLNISEGLPNVPINSILREKQSNDVLYLATDIGVYFRDASMSSWQLFSTSLPNVVVSELEIQYSGSVLRAGTRGRGLWETPIILSNPEAPVVVIAKIVSETQIELTFNRAMEDPAGKHTEFVVNNGQTIIPSSISLKSGTDNIYIIELPESIQEGQVVTVSYNGVSIQSTSGDELAAFVNKGVKNDLGSVVKSISKSDEIKIFPNPNTGEFEIEYTGKQSTNFTIRLISMNGQVLFVENLKNMPRQFRQKINLPQGFKGIYQLLIETDKTKYQQSLIIE